MNSVRVYGYHVVPARLSITAFVARLSMAALVARLSRAPCQRDGAAELHGAHRGVRPQLGGLRGRQAGGKPVVGDGVAAIHRERRGEERRREERGGEERRGEERRGGRHDPWDVDGN